MTLGEGRDGLALLDRASTLRLLLLQDSVSEQEPVLAMLEEHFPRAEVAVESDLGSAMTHLRCHPVDVVVMAMSAPDFDSAAAVKVVRETCPETAMLVLTGRAHGDLALWTLAETSESLSSNGWADGLHPAAALLRALHGRRVEEQAHRYLQLARGLLDAFDSPACAVDAHGAIVVVNRAWRDFVVDNDGADGRCGVGVSYLETCDRAATDDERVGAADAQFVARGVRQVVAGTTDRFEHDYACHSPDEDRWFTVRVTPASINDGRGAVITHANITAVQEARRTVRHRSLHDLLTDLPNRLLARERVEQAVEDAARRGRVVAVAQLDLDHFQRINDRVGFRGGDAVLVQVAERLRAQLRPGDTAARISGDGFLMLWRDLGPGTDEVVQLGEALLRTLDLPFEVEGRHVKITASVVVAVHAAGMSVDQVLRSMDTAAHDRTRRRTGQVVLLTDESRRSAAILASLAEDLQQALEGSINELVLHYQPVVDLASGSVVAVEALVRWEHPVHGILGPDQFIPLAEAAGLIHVLGAWVLDQALSDAPQLVHDGRQLDIAVNVSVLQLDDRLASSVSAALHRSGVRSGRLMVEVTESAIAEDENVAVAALEALSGLGVTIAIDDFGTGYSSMHYLRRYPINTLKIDREFVEGLGGSAEDEAICRSVVGLAEAMSATTIGEGVETAEQHVVLRSMGCVQGQGFLWSRPAPVDELVQAFAACDEVPVAEPISLSSGA